MRFLFVYFQKYRFCKRSLSSADLLIKKTQTRWRRRYYSCYMHQIAFLFKKHNFKNELRVHWRSNFENYPCNRNVKNSWKFIKNSEPVFITCKDSTTWLLCENYIYRNVSRVFRFVQIRLAMKARDLVVVGWYHSHPTYQSDPSVRDIATQQHYQKCLKVEKFESEPCVGFIICK